ncbi:MAG TPA: glycogen-binding domain-containing protein [Candidatus Paceibacterota bacterium]|nr:glycogen-binding domain-containing protein [Candidatus Paceibacterota bacterium]
MMKTTKKTKRAAKTSSPKTATASVAASPAPPTQPAAAQETPAVSAEAAPVEPKVETPKCGQVTLELVKPDAKSVCVAGTFNQWRPEQTPLRPAGNGRWVGDLRITPGRYEYLFVVDGQWVPDPNARETVRNPFGGQNCVLTVSA